MESGPRDVSVPRPGYRPGHPGPSSELWESRMRLPWHLAFAGVLGITLLSVYPSDGVLSGRTWAALLALVVIGVAYVVLVVPARRMASGPVLAYLTILVLAMGVATYGDTIATVFLFVGFTHTWALTGSRKLGTIFSAVLAVSCGAGLALGLGGSHGLIAGLLASVCSFAFSVAMGLSIQGIVDRVFERQRLAADLAEAQRELAAARFAEDLAAQRERIAQEIHDTLAQGFTSIVMLAQVARGDAESGRAGAAAGRLQLIEDTARENLATARALVAATAPVELTDGGIAPALERLAARFAHETGVQTRAQVAVLPPDSGRDVVLLRACQEALANVRKHAQASSARIELASDGGEVVLRVTDDGVGLGAGFTPGIGLESMSARASSAGGTLSVMGREAGGTCVELRLPGAGAGQGSVA